MFLQHWFGRRIAAWKDAVAVAVAGSTIKNQRAAKPVPPRRLELAELEDRVLFSASPLPPQLITDATFADQMGELGEVPEAVPAGGDGQFVLSMPSSAIAESAEKVGPAADTLSNQTGKGASGSAPVPLFQQAGAASTSQWSLGDGEVPISDPAWNGDYSHSLYDDRWQFDDPQWFTESIGAAAEPGTRHELVFIDATAQDYQQLIDDVRANRDDGRRFDLIVLDSSRDGIEQISATLSQYHDIDAVHIASHGVAGAVKLGNTWLRLDNVGTYAGQLAGWRDALSGDADLLFYGCDLAAHDDGKRLVESLSELTGADVAASVDQTGAAVLGGNWNLEYTVGSIQSQLAFSLDVQQNWLHLMAAETVRDNFSVVSYSNNDGTQSWSTDWIENDSQGGGATGGRIFVTPSFLRIFAATVDNWIYRQADLSGATSATFSFSLNNQLGGDTISVQVSGDGGGSFATLASITSATADGTYSFDITPYASANTRLRFYVAQAAGNKLALDDIQIAYIGNSAPVLSGANNLAAINEDDTNSIGTLVSTLMAGHVTDADAGALSGIAVTAVDNTNGTWQYTTNGGGTWTAFAVPTATAARLLAANASTSVRFIPVANFNGTVTPGITFRAWDQISGTAGSTADTSINGGTTAFSSATASSSITVNSVNDAPLIGLPGGATGFTEGGAATVIDSAATVTDADSADFDTGTLTADFTANGTADDRLAIRNQGTGAGQIGVSGSNVTYGGVLIGTFSGGVGTTPLVVNFTSTGATPAAAQALLRNITYQNVSDDPSTAARTVRFVVTDGDGGTSNAATKTINVSAVNDPPVVSTTGSPLPYTENAAASAIDPGLTISDVDNANLSGATVTVSANYASGQDVLAFTDQLGITASWNAATGMLTLSGTTTVANYQTALRSVTYFNSSDNPSTLVRTVAFVVNDGAANSTAATCNITVTAVNDPPVVTTTGGSLSYTENAAATAIDTGLTVGDLDNTNLTSATVTILANYANGQDVLGFTDQLGITGSWNVSTGVLTLSGTTTVANYQTALRSVTYFNSSDDPSTLVRTVSFVVNDGAANSTAATRNISLNAVNDPPVISTTATPLTYTENDGAVFIDNGLTVSDRDNTNLVGATISISANYLSGEDLLAFCNTANITGVWNAATGVLTLSGSDTVANYQAALRSMTYANTSYDPSTLTRTVSFVTDDGTNTSTAVTRDVAITAVNDAPVPTTTASPLAYTENDGAVAFDIGLAVSDVDNANLAGATISISAGYVLGEDVLAFTNTANITGSWNAAGGVLTLSGSDSVANYQAALRSVTYTNTSENPATATRTIATFVDDGTDISSTVTRDIAIAAVNDAPVVNSSPAALSYTENDPATPVDPALTISDVDSADLIGATVRLSAGFLPGEDVLSFTDQLGITGSYNAATGELTLAGIAAVPDYQAALRSVTYQNTSDNPSTAPRTVTFDVDDGFDTSSAQRTVNVIAVNDAPLAVDDVYSVNEDTPLSTSAALGVLGNDGDVDGDPLSAVLVSGPANGSLMLAADGSFVYTPAMNFRGTDSFTYRASDAALLSNVATVTIAVGPQNHAPVAIAESYSVDNNATLTVFGRGVLANDRDIDGDSLTAVLVSGPSSGTLRLNADGSFTYLPNPNFAGTDSFSYRANDGSLDSNIATVTITVSAVAGPISDSPPNGSGVILDANVLAAEPGEDRDRGSGFFELEDNAPAAPQQVAKRSAPSSAEFEFHLLKDIKVDRGHWLVNSIDVDLTLENSVVLKPAADRTDAAARNVSRLEMETLSESGLLWSKLDGLKGELTSDWFDLKFTVGVATTLTAALSVGYVMWTLRGGYLLASMLSTLPAWRMIDPLPILDNFDAARRPVKPLDEEQSETLESIVVGHTASLESANAGLEVSLS